MKRRIFCRRAAALLLAGCVALGAALAAAPEVSASSWDMTYFLKTYSDPHFNLKNDPDRAMTVEEFIAVVYAYSYYGGGSAKTPAKDKNGRQPSAWCAKFVQAEVDKATVTPSAVSWTAPATVAFAAQFLARAKGKYSYDFNNFYTFTGTSGLSAEDRMYLNVAVDCGLIAYRAGMDVSAKIPRKNAPAYEIPSGTVSLKAAAAGSTAHMLETDVFFPDCYWDLDLAASQLAELKSLGGEVTAVTFSCGYLNGAKVSAGNDWLGCDLSHDTAVKCSDSYTRDPQLDAVDYCHETGKLALLGVSNASNNAFTVSTVTKLLSSQANMDAAIGEIAAAVERYGLDGVHMDIELTASGKAMRGAYGTFLGRLGDALHARGCLLMTSVGAYFTDAQESASFYDYRTIGRVSDYVNLILYDDFNDTSYAYRRTTGPMSNIIRIGRVMRYAAAVMGPAKLQLGMSSFATDFNTTALTAEDITYTEASARMAAHGSAVAADVKEGGGHFTYAAADGNHIVYFETPAGIAARAALVCRYRFSGVSVYYLGSGYPALYQTISKNSACKKEVVSAMEAGLVPAALRSGYADAITRADFCTLIAAFLEKYSGKSLTDFLASKNAAAKSGAFSDTDDGSILAAAALGIVTGYSDGTFRPAQGITRREAAVMLQRLAGVVGCGASGTALRFSDMASQPEWARTGVAFVSACADPVTGGRVMNGTGAASFGPLGSYTREQSMMTMIRLYHAAKG